MRLSRNDLERQVETYRAKALQEHDGMRYWQNRALAAEQKLADMQQDIGGNTPNERATLWP
ncbi:hypothetical protein FBY33_3631 [Arthrobacter sp. SLBN-112]|uniref:hypothetical protein n=1 Tax=Arthrobacter sp. SLBN-112 TaxID=2768452 RepID=UPI0011544FF6|nr:hypothetical protein [Arthrobacter sp. SLBN-112]TQJ41516.1 hypothetical protein FBY33_3631 [Arthrobacter sp. SLBN-112]